MRRSLALSLSIVAMLVVLLPGSPAAARQPLSLGAASENATSMAEVDAFTQRTGAKPRLWTLWSSWGDRQGSDTCVEGLGSCAFPTQAANGLRQRGITPIIWWQPTGPGN